jgi:DNA helicase-2/ATP-dependent DNA helicase PcrA
MLTRTLTPTVEQSAIVEAARSTKDSILISALAGAAKTSTLEMLCHALPVQPILCLAFNKRIATEMKERLPGHVSVKTLNALGHGIWAAATGKRLVLNTRKSYELLKGKVDALPRPQRLAAYDTFSETLKAVGQAKTAGYIPNGTFPSARRLINQSEFAEGLEDGEANIELVETVLTDSIRLAYEGQIDFDDQIYMPSLFGGTFPRFPLVMVDEAQDLSPLNHTMLEKLVTSRLIAVGDPFQSIYGFRGALSNGMDALRNRHSMTEMVLSTSFRCPRAIVRRAQSRAPHMNWPDWAEEGAIHEPKQWSSASIPEGSAIICRNNAPLFRLGFALIRSGRGVSIVGSDVGPGLVKVLKKLGPESMRQFQVMDAIDDWEEARGTKAKSKESVADRAECLRVFAEHGDTLSAAVAYAEHLFKSQGTIQLLSGHKSKGLEWNTVYHLDPWRIPSKYAQSEEALEQESNLDYVITTRAKRELWLVNAEDFRG